MAKMRCASRVLNFGYRGRIELFLPQATLSSPPPSPETPPPTRLRFSCRTESDLRKGRWEGQWPVAVKEWITR